MTLANRKFDVAELSTTVERDRRHEHHHRRPGVRRRRCSTQLETNPGRYDLSSVAVIIVVGRDVEPGEQGAACSSTCRNAMLFDSFGSSEAVGMGASVSAPGAAEQTAKFMLGDRTARCSTRTAARVEPGSGERGMVAVGGFLPRRLLQGRGQDGADLPDLRGPPLERARRLRRGNDDGTLHLLGRGSVCINTGGEKVFPEEVEEALKTHPAVRDAVVVGVPDAAVRRGDLRGGRDRGRRRRRRSPSSPRT